MPSLTAITTVLLAATALASPLDTRTSSSSTSHLVARGQSGTATYYNPGLGACGKTNSDGDLIVAVAGAALNNKASCGRKLRAEYQGKTIQVEAVDLCPGCGPSDLDLSPTAFQQLVGGLDAGRVAVTWDWI